VSSINIMASKLEIVHSATLVNAPMTSIKWEELCLLGAIYLIILKGKGLYDHLTLDKPQKTSSNSLWEQEDKQIMSLMLNSIEPHIGSS
jgi:hypothetical protein